jgi:hypothetical protein
MHSAEHVSSHGFGQQYSNGLSKHLQPMKAESDSRCSYFEELARKLLRESDMAALEELQPKILSRHEFSASPEGDPLMEYIQVTAALVLIFFASLIPISRPISDFLPFYAGGKILGPQIYSSDQAIGVEREVAPDLMSRPEANRVVTRPPFYYLPFWPLSHLDYRVAVCIWAIGSLMAGVGFLLLWPCSTSKLLKYSTWFFPLMMALMQAQDCLVLLLIIATSATLRSRGRNFAAGLVLSLCSAKPSTLLFMPLAPVSFRSWRSGGGLVAGWSALYVLSAAITHDAAWPIQYARHITGTLGYTNAVPVPVIAISAAILTFWCNKKSPFVATAVLACGGMLLSPRALYYDLMLSIPLVSLLLNRGGWIVRLLTIYPFAAASAWYFAGWNAARVVVAVLLVCGLLLLKSEANTR